MSSSLLVLFFLSSVMTIAGASLTIFSKLQNQTEVHRKDGSKEFFLKPWFQTLTLFIGMLFAVFPECFRRICLAKKEQKKLSSKDQKLNKWMWLILGGFMFADIIGLVMLNVALIWIPASLWQMLRGSIVFFAALLTIFYRKRKLFRFEWIGVGLVLLAFVLLGVVVLMNQLNNGKPLQEWWKILLGLLFILFGQFMQAVISMFQEVFIHDADVPTMTLVLAEGVWGTAMCLGLFMPIAQFLPGTEGQGLREDSGDTLRMLGQQPQLIVYAVLYALSILFYNLFTVFVIAASSALTRNVIDPVRTLLVWVVQLVLHYAGSAGFGERWTGWSFLQLGGFALMTAGVLCYNAVFPWRVLLGEKGAEERERRRRQGQGAVGVGVDGGGGKKGKEKMFGIEEEEVEAEEEEEEDKENEEGATPLIGNQV